MATEEQGGDTTRVPPMIGAIPLVGDLARNADAQARWMQDVMEQNARLLGQLPATMRSFNDAIERFNETVAKLDRTVTRFESASRSLTAPVEKLAASLDPKTLRDIPDALNSLRQEAVPALRAAADTQRQVALLQSTIERVLAAVGEVPGAGRLLRRGKPDQPGPRPSAEGP